jgi:hypothetical protein
VSNAVDPTSSSRSLYLEQNKTIHRARIMIGMDIGACREIAKQIGGEPSIRGLSIRQRWELIEELKLKGARIRNPSLVGCGVSSAELNARAEKPLSFDQVYPAHLEFWNSKFPRRRPGFASNKQLAWIQTMWEIDFTQGKGDMGGLRKFIARQTQSLPDGPVSDLAFLRNSQVQVVITPLKNKARVRMLKRRNAD